MKLASETLATFEVYCRVFLVLLASGHRLCLEYISFEDTELAVQKLLPSARRRDWKNRTGKMAGCWACGGTFNNDESAQNDCVFEAPMDKERVCEFHGYVAMR